MQSVEENLRILYDEGKLKPDSSYNEVVFAYWRRFDRYGTSTIDPAELTPCESITRCWRLNFRGEKGDEDGVINYVKDKKDMEVVGSYRDETGQLRLRYA